MDPLTAQQPPENSYHRFANVTLMAPDHKMPNCFILFGLSSTKTVGETKEKS